ncbi:MAG: bifunctional metallophosphatase/5'-nucleotidase [Verrucomicrobiota bacterium]
MKNIATIGALSATLLAVSFDAHAGGYKKPSVDFVLTILHNNDGESDLIASDVFDDDDNNLGRFGGIDHFTTLVNQLRREAYRNPSSDPSFPRRASRGAIMLSSGDNFLAGPEFNASLENGIPFFDGIGLGLIGYQALCIGNHEFDFGPETFAAVINSFRFSRPPFLSANLDVSPEPTLAILEDANRIASARIVRRGRRLIGIVGATTPNLPFISSPRDVAVEQDVAAAVQDVINQATYYGAKIIILVSHLQGVSEDEVLLAQLRKVDVVIAGGGDELLANDKNLLIGDESPQGPYPSLPTDADGKQVPLITTSGSYFYVGRLVAGFDRFGNLIAIDNAKSGPVRVAAGDQDDAVRSNLLQRRLVVEPVQAAVDALATNVIANSEVPLNGITNDIRSIETNEGNLIADAYLARATALAPTFGAPTPDVALANGGGIRNDSILPAGDFTELDTFNILPFLNFLVVVEGLTAQQFKDQLESCVSKVVDVGGRPVRQGDGTGRFAQIAGFTFEYDITAQALELDGDGNVITPGERIISVALDDGTDVVVAGVPQGGVTINVATVDFLARGGDQYFFSVLSPVFTILGETYQQVLENYTIDLGSITATQYPVGGEGRITPLGLSTP